MESLKDVDLKILFQLMKDSRISDRQLAKRIGISQPTVTRRRTKLENNAIDGYTAIPKWDRLGYGILAITLIKALHIFSAKKCLDIRKRGLQWLNTQPNVIMAGPCEGMGVNAFIISVHRDFSDHSDFMLKLRLEMAEFIDDAQTVLVDLKGKERMKPLHLKYLTQTKQNLSQKDSGERLQVFRR